MSEKIEKTAFNDCKMASTEAPFPPDSPSIGGGWWYLSHKGWLWGSVL